MASYPYSVISYFAGACLLCNVLLIYFDLDMLLQYVVVLVLLNVLQAFGYIWILDMLLKYVGELFWNVL